MTDYRGVANESNLSTDIRKTTLVLCVDPFGQAHLQTTAGTVRAARARVPSHARAEVSEKADPGRSAAFISSIKQRVVDLSR
jgi:hypothetical protein